MQKKQSKTSAQKSRNDPPIDAIGMIADQTLPRKKGKRVKSPHFMESVALTPEAIAFAESVLKKRLKK